MSLTSVAAPIWNEIAKTQKLRTAWARKAFALDGMEMAELEDREWKALIPKVGKTVAGAYSDLKPLLLENVAISRYIQATQDGSLRAALPEVVSISEAIALASMDRRLSPEQQTSLKSLLKAEYSDRGEQEPCPVNLDQDGIATADADFQAALRELGDLLENSLDEKGPD